MRAVATVITGLLFSAQAFGFDIRSLMPQPSSAAQLQTAQEFPELSAGPYPNKEAFLRATASGEIYDDYLSQPEANQSRPIAYSVLTILQADYGLPSVRPLADVPKYEGQVFRWKNYCLAQLQGQTPELLRAFYEFRLGAAIKGVWFQNTLQQITESNWCVTDNSGFSKKLMKSWGLFMQDYSNAIDVRIATLKEQRRQEELAAAEARKEAARVAEEERIEQEKIDAERASQLAIEAAQRQADDDARAALAAKRSQERDTCLASSAYKIAEASWKIDNGRSAVTAGESILANDDQLKKTAGVTNLGNREKGGQMIVVGKKMIGDAFTSYKQNGGKVGDPYKVPKMPDPCAQYR